MLAGRTRTIPAVLANWRLSHYCWTACLSTMATTSEFERLLSRARQGDEHAMGQLVEQYEPEVRIVARARLGSALRPHLDSLDLVQSVHRSLLVGLRADRFDISSPDKLVALAVTIVRRKVARHWRKHKRQVRPQDGPGHESVGLPAMLQSLASSDTDPAHAAAMRDACEQLLRELDGADRSVMELRLEGHTTAEVARRLGLDADVLRVRLGRLRRRLRDRGILSEWL
ncbi:MAG: sigma-70 family RNA polymerase sigma factor [Pirellulaceae bacterium]